jgi:hypothetical protein
VSLQERLRPALHRDKELERLNCLGEKPAARLAYQRMKVLTRHDGSESSKAVSQAHGRKRKLKEAPRRGSSEMRKAAITTERREAIFLLSDNERAPSSINSLPSAVSKAR